MSFFWKLITVFSSIEEEIEEVPDFDSFGSLIANNDDGFKEVKRGLRMATQKLKNIKKNFGRSQLKQQN